MGACIQIQRSLAHASDAVMLSPVLQTFGNILNSFHDACLAQTGTLVIVKDLNAAQGEVNCIAEFFDDFIKLAKDHIVVPEWGRRTTSFPGAYLALCLTPIFKLDGHRRWNRSKEHPFPAGLASADAMVAHATRVGEACASGYKYLKGLARAPQGQRTHDRLVGAQARGLINVMLNMLAMALGFTLYSRTEDPTQSIKLLLFGKCRCATQVLKCV
jgi:hypothetical protein